jgi:phosphatidylinositol 4-kinase
MKEIEQFLKPLAILLKHNGEDVNFALRFGFTGPLRDFWLNCLIHGISYGSEVGRKHAESLQIIAKYTPPVIAGVSEEESFDTKLEDASLLKRGMTPQNTVEHKKALLRMLPSEEVAVRPLSYPRVIYLETAYTLECFRSEGGGCSKVLAYFVEPAFKTGEASTVMAAIAGVVTDVYINKILSGNYPQFSATNIADQLADIFVGCCHRLPKVQTVAVSMANRIISTVPSALCKRPSLFALLELLTLLWASCLQEETDEYATKSLFSSTRGRVVIEMPDSFQFRRKTLNNFHALAKGWMTKAVNIAPLDLKGLLQTYLSEFEDESTLGHVALGRSFALEIGSLVPTTDQRLGE